MLMVDQSLHAAGSTEPCAREETEAAFGHLTGPVNGIATYLEAQRTIIVILICLSHRSSGDRRRH
jgi:hypothetical protein